MILIERIPKQWLQHHPDAGLISYEKSFNVKLSGNEIYYTACSLLVMFKKCVVNFITRKVSI